MNPEESLFTCSFCGATKTQQRHFIVGPGVNICGDCVAICVDMIVEQRGEIATNLPPAPLGWSVIEVRSGALVIETAGAILTVSPDSIEVDYGDLAPAVTSTPPEHFAWLAKLSGLIATHGADATFAAIKGAA